MQNNNASGFSKIVVMLISIIIISSVLVSLIPRATRQQPQPVAPPSITPLPPRLLELQIIGSQAMVQKRYQEAVEAYSEILEINPGMAEAYTQRSVAYKELQLYRQAGSDIDTAIVLAGTSAGLLVQRAEIFAAEEKYPEALQAYNAAIALDAGNLAAYNGRGIAHLKLGDVENALADLDHVIATAPNQFNARLNRGYAYEALKRYEDALADYNAIIAAAGDAAANAYMRRGLVYSKMGQTDQALADFEKANSLGVEDLLIYNERGVIYTQLNQPQKALAEFNRAIVLAPQNANLYYNRGVIYVGLKDYAAALREYNQAIALDAANGRYYLTRGIVHYATGDFEKAIADYDKAIQLQPENADGFQNRGNAYAESGQLEAAIQDYTRAIELNPDSFDAYYNRGVVYYRLDRFDEALADFSALIAKHTSKTAQALNMRAAVYIARKEYDAALTDLNKASEVDPQLAGTYYKRALVYVGLGKKAEAVADLRFYLTLETNSEVRAPAEQLLKSLGG